MPFQVTCPKCSKTLELPDTLLGKTIRCKSCEQVFAIGQPEGLAPARSAPVRREAASTIQPFPSAPQSPPVLQPAPERPPTARRETRIRRLRPRSRIPVFVWIAGGFGAGLFCMMALSVVAYLLIKGKSSDGSDAKAVASIQTERGQDSPPSNRQAEQPPQQQQQLPFPPPPGFGGAPPGGNLPPDNGQGSKKPGQGFPVVLSNGRIGSAIGFQRSFSVDYAFEQGGPGPGQFFFVVIKSPSSTAEAQISPLRIASKGTFHLREIGIRTRDNGPFEVHLETGMPGPFGQRLVVSNTIKLSP